jgi:hypothetical protein
VSAWDADRAFERARVAYRYVAANFPESADLEILAPFTRRRGPGTWRLSRTPCAS